ncbi:hypothetical protein CC80DRAFT_545061 [Byssothecium circinans]|uniref:Uncharacterized protein n=1 Tax=Byssothecium circinans TaxID=147558 RepID=A0A6A5U4L9_9PLEO|nr:hypothetical protein CC80DRAFT_545061 [Byssothecium circinans]
MPMNWTAENDRLLLLKLIETHGITVNAELIAKAWPKDAPAKPTARAVKERFVKLRELASIKASIRSNNSTPSKIYTARTPKTPRSSAKKRKVESSESDAEDHFTDEAESPTGKRKSVQRGSSKHESSAVRVKAEDPDTTFDDFEALQERSSILREHMDDPFNRSPGGASPSNGFAGNVGMGGLSSYNMGMSDALSSPASRIQIGSHAKQRVRSSREASRNASSAWKDDDSGFSGAKSSDDASDFQVPAEDSDNDYM